MLDGHVKIGLEWNSQKGLIETLLPSGDSWVSFSLSVVTWVKRAAVFEMVARFVPREAFARCYFCAFNLTFLPRVCLPFFVTSRKPVSPSMHVVYTVFYAIVCKVFPCPIKCRPCPVVVSHLGRVNLNLRLILRRRWLLLKWVMFDLSHLSLLASPETLREHLLQKRMFSFGHCPKREGGGGPCPNLLALFPPCNCPLYLDMNIILCEYFVIIFNTKITKSTKIIITIITIIIVTWLCNTR